MRAGLSPHPPAPDPVPPTAVAPRSGDSPLERAALARARLDIAAMPASTVVQLVLWPETLAEWARTESLQSALIYNALHRVKPYRRIREHLARRLDVANAVLDHLIDAPRPLATALRPPVPVPFGAHEDTGADSVGDGTRGARDGSGLLERMALARLEIDLAALPASVIVQLALWPDTIAAWARREWPRGAGGAAAMTYALLADSQHPDRIERALARRLSVPPAVLRALIVAPCPEPSSRRPVLEFISQPAPQNPPRGTAAAAVRASPRTFPRPARHLPSTPPASQLHLGI